MELIREMCLLYSIYGLDVSIRDGSVYGHSLWLVSNCSSPGRFMVWDLKRGKWIRRLEPCEVRDVALSVLEEQWTKS